MLSLFIFLSDHLGLGKRDLGNCHSGQSNPFEWLHSLDNDTEAGTTLSAITCKENLCSETSGNYRGLGRGPSGRFFFEIPSPNKSAWTD